MNGKTRREELTAFIQRVLARNPEWIFLGRGEKRERQDELGFKVGHVTDEIPSRGIWRHYRRLMEAV